MIIYTQEDDKPFVAGEMLATILQAPPIVTLKAGAALDFCFCGYNCEYVEYAFIQSSGSDETKNDKTQFLFKKLRAADTITVKILKAGVEVVTITDQAYGEYYNGFANQPLYVGGVIYWKNVQDAFGYGQYKIKVEKNILGEATEATSHVYHVLEYNAILANRTVLLESYQDGNIIGSDLDYTGLSDGGWYQRIRLNGKFHNKLPTLNVSNTEDVNYKKEQIRDHVTYEYTLRINKTTGTIMNWINDNYILGNVVKVTDFNLFNPHRYNQIELYASAIEDVSEINKTELTRFSVIFEDKISDIIKRNK